MSLHYRFLNGLGFVFCLVGMLLAAPGAFLIWASDWCTDRASEGLRDQKQGGLR